MITNYFMFRDLFKDQKFVWADRLCMKVDDNTMLTLEDNEYYSVTDEHAEEMLCLTIEES